MFNIYKYRQHIIWFCLTIFVILTPTMVEAVISNETTSNYQIAENPHPQDIKDEQKIIKALLLDAQKQNWQPKIGKITIVDSYALATTYDRNTGGESVLKKEQGVWQVISGTGGAFSNPEELASIAKVPLATARRLLEIRSRQQR
ncbi:MAG TPA: hypothetical protein DEV81_15955 [Cyanobacteria bacterium UBA11049]|nr:hypothetical protein [Cyanobacteria bacterium UBA11049]